MWSGGKLVDTLYFEDEEYYWILIEIFVVELDFEGWLGICCRPSKEEHFKQIKYCISNVVVINNTVCSGVPQKNLVLLFIIRHC